MVLRTMPGTAVKAQKVSAITTQNLDLTLSSKTAKFVAQF